MLGYILSKLISKEGDIINKKLPLMKIKFFQFSPEIHIHFKNKTLHLHHWLYFTIVLVITLTFNINFLDNIFAKGYLVGGILQGLSFSDWKGIIVRKN